MFERFKRSRELMHNRKLANDEKVYFDEEGNGIIDVGAEEYSDIFSYYSLNGYNVLDTEFNNFIEAKADTIPMKRNLTMVFHIKDANTEKLCEIKNAVKDNYEREIFAINREMHRNTIFSLIMLIVGLSIFGIYILANIFEFSFIFTAVAEIGAWVFLWESVDKFFLQRSKLKSERLKKYRLMKANIKVKEFAIKKVRMKWKTFN